MAEKEKTASENYERQLSVLRNKPVQPIDNGRADVRTDGREAEYDALKQELQRVEEVHR